MQRRVRDKRKNLRSSHLLDLHENLTITFKRVTVRSFPNISESNILAGSVRGRVAAREVDPSTSALRLHT